MFDPMRNVSVKRLYTHNILRILTAGFFWSLFYQLFTQFFTKTMSFANFFDAIKHTILLDQRLDISTHLYFIRLIFIFYVCTPIVRLLTKHASKRQLQYFLVLWLILAILYPTICQYYPFRIMGTIVTEFPINTTYAGIGYGVAGYYLKKYHLPPSCCTICFGAGFIMTYALTVLLTIMHGKLYAAFLGGMTPGICLMAIGIFGFLIQRRYTRTISTIAERISRASFCIYFVHMAYVYVLSYLNIHVLVMPCIISIPFCVFLTFVLSYITYVLLSRNSTASKYII